MTRSERYLVSALNRLAKTCWSGLDREACARVLERHKKLVGRKRK